MHTILHLITRIFTFTALRYFVIAGIFFALFYGLIRERFTRNKIQQKHAGKKDFRREILHSLQSSLVFTIISYIIFLTPFSKYTLVYHNLSDHSIVWLVFSLLLCLIIHDTYFYWMHRLLHHPKIFRLTHLLHHRSTNPSPWAAYSFHFIESWTEGAVLLLIALILPVHILTIALFTIISLIINAYGHLGYEIMPRSFRSSFLFEIFNTSVHHNMHHSKFKGNYGLYFRIWDRLMGTEHPDYVREYDRIQGQRFSVASPANS
ncbi:sterol desaturase family protein [Flavitalea sp. BT771]|uniref:sterol desaturase family protein n=1 Tax=Flavitalea sp. BT771 TaxID=3063329 RepID=UPI0026E3B08A|nr:sterol desaturase family protein [Flavitalea sp. BT771]MDO6434824.1 sterol desaturase family protein [Flavitalea sp. BT771]MDV6223724.1 sterol desaturase family protein [Flavitalea sp. BT771]